MGERVETVGEQIRRRREACGLQQQELAKLSGMSRNFIGQLEVGQTNPRPSSLGAVLRALTAREAELGIDTTVDDPDFVTVILENVPGEPTKIVLKGRPSPDLAETIMKLVDDLERKREDARDKHR